jgi:restriction system protein
VAQGSGRAGWEPRLAAQIDRQARERAREAREREKAQEQERTDAGQRTAAEKTTEVERRIAALDQVLTSVLPLPPTTFDRLMKMPDTPRFDARALSRQDPAPDWIDFAPVRSRGLRRFLDAFGRRQRELASARGRFATAQLEHEQRESQRQQALAAAKARHDQKITQQRAAAAARNTQIRRHKSAFDAGDAEAVRWFIGCVLDASRYPDGFPREYQVTYHPDSRDVAVEFGLPPDSIVPSTTGYRYVADRDAAEPLPRPQNEIKQRHERLIAAVALRTLHEIFSATPPDVIRAAEFEGYLTSVDPATGKNVRRRLLSLRADRPVFEDLVLAAVEPEACVARLSLVGEPGGAERVEQRAERLQVDR